MKKKLAIAGAITAVGAAIGTFAFKNKELIKEKTNEVKIKVKGKGDADIVDSEMELDSEIELDSVDDSQKEKEE